MTKTAVLILGNLLSDRVGTRSVGEDLAAKLRSSGWTVIAASSRRRRLSRLADMLFTILKHRHDYDIAYVEVYSGLAFFWAELSCALLKALRKSIVLTLHGGNLPRFAQRWPRRVRRLLRAADAVTTPSSYIQSTFMDDRGDMRLLRNAIELSDYTFRPRKQLEPKLVWLRAFHRLYNPILAVETLSRLQDEFPNVRLTMFGPDKGDHSLHALQMCAHQTGVADHLHIAGSIPKSEVPEYLALHDIFLNTTTTESFGVSVIEAAALGMCIVTTNVGELPYIWTHEHDAMLVAADNPTAMADAVRRLLTEPGLAEHLSRNARVKAEQFDWATILPLWEGMLKEILEKAPHA